MNVTSLWRIENGKLVLPFHYGQTQGWDSQKRFVFILAGTQSGKTAFLPWWLWRSIKETHSPDGNNDYIATTANYDLFKLKFLPEMRTVFEYVLKIGRYWSGERVIELRPNLDRDKPFWAKRVDDPMWGRIILRSAASPAGLESATAKAAILDEAGQDEYTLETWEAILRRLSLHQGRVCAATTLYNLGWLKSEIYDAWKNGEPDIDVFQFASIQNPAFPKAEFERAKTKMQAWRFAMFYLGQFSKPAGLIYDCFEDSMLVDPFPIPADWARMVGVDFGGANTAVVYLAENPDTEIWYLYREYLEGGLSSNEHAAKHRANLEGLEYQVVGGAKSETQQRMDWSQGGLYVNEPSVSDVEAGIDKVYQLIKEGRFRLFRSCRGIRDELGGYRRKLDERGEPTEEIVDKRKFHRCFIAGTLVSAINGDIPIEDIKIGDLVLTRYGYSPVLQISKTMDTVRPFLFSNGKMLIATLDHPVWTNDKGYIELRALRYGDIIETSNKYKRMFQWQTLLNSMARNIIVILMRKINQIGDITTIREVIFIGRYRNIIMVQSLKAIIFTIEMVIRSIMTYRILSVLIQKSIQFVTSLRELMNLGKQWITRVASLLNGIGQKKAEHGIGKLEDYPGKMYNQLNWYAKIATKNLRLSPSMAILDSAPMFVNPHIGASPESMMKQENVNPVNQNLEQTDIVRFDIALDDAPDQVKVYNITVQNGEYFANGILTHNCDALRYAASWIRTVSFSHEQSMPLNPNYYKVRR